MPVTFNPTDTSGAGSVNAHDHWGVWRRIHALADYAFTGDESARPIAFGEDARMGKWRFYVMRPVTPIEPYFAPVLNSSISPTFIWANKCFFALGSPCP